MIAPPLARLEPMPSRQMFHWIKEQWLRLELRCQQWEHHKRQAGLLSDSDLRYHAAGRGFNLQLAKACKHELRNRR
jgi:hypothetical protein